MREDLPVLRHGNQPDLLGGLGMERCKDIHAPRGVLVTMSMSDAPFRVSGTLPSAAKKPDGPADSKILSSRAAACPAAGGGEEFLVRSPGTAAGDAVQLAERMRGTLRATPFEGGRTYTLSGGEAAYGEGDTVDSLLHRADVALYRAKNAGRDRVEVEQG